MSDIKGQKNLNRKLDNISNLTPVLEAAMKREIRRVRNAAVTLCPANHGELRQSIRTDVTTERDAVIGICYTNNQYAAYVEFGTGPKGAADHAGISPNVHPTYVQKGWWFPGKGIPPQDADKYHWPKIETEEGTPLYFTTGQAAQPFMYPALTQNEDIIKNNIAKAVRDGIKKGVSK